MQNFGYGQSGGQYELSLCARKLISRDTFSNSDPQCIVYQKDTGSGKWIELGRTEVVKDNCNPDWIKRFVVDPRSVNELKFEIWDFDPITGNEFLGRVETTLTAVLGSGTNGYRQHLIGAGFTGKSRIGGELQIRFEAVNAYASSQNVTLQFSADKVERKDFLGKSDPYLLISRCLPDGSFTVCHRTEHISNTTKPVWKPFSVDVQHLCGSDWNRIIKIECFDWDENSDHDFIGSCTTTLQRLAEGPSQGNIYELINQKKVGNRNYSNSGFLKLISCSISGGAPAQQQPQYGAYQQSGQTGYTPNPNFGGSPQYPQGNMYPQPTSYPNPTNYPAQCYPQSYPSNLGYPAAPNQSYPSLPGYPQQVGFAPPQVGYPPQQPGYPASQAGYPSQPPMYPTSQSGYPSAAYPQYPR